MMIRSHLRNVRLLVQLARELSPGRDDPLAVPTPASDESRAMKNEQKMPTIMRNRRQIIQTVVSQHHDNVEEASLTMEHRT